MKGYFDNPPKQIEYIKKISMMYRKVLMFALIAATTSLVSTNLKAQQVEVGARAGLNLSNIYVKDENGRVRSGSQALPGFNAGLTFDIPIADEFYLQPGALITTKGAKIKGDTYQYLYNDTYYNGDYTNYNAYYLEVPVNFLYKPQAGPGRILLGAGPYFAYGLGGNWKDDFNGKVTTGKLEFINDWNQRTGGSNTFTYGKRFDMGVNVLGGYEFPSRFSVQVNGSIGAANIEPNDNGRKPTAIFRNRGVGISVGYKF